MEVCHTVEYATKSGEFGIFEFYTYGHGEFVSADLRNKTLEKISSICDLANIKAVRVDGNAL